MAKGKKVIHVRSKRKEAIARATLTKGAGYIIINKMELDTYPEWYKILVYEPINLFGGREKLKDYNIDINVQGGGIVGQAQAVRTAIARVLVSLDPKIKEVFINTDKYLLVEDVRRVEPKKQLGRKARARFQKSFR